MDISIGMVGEGGTKWAKAPVDEQAERIKESVRDYYKNPQEYGFAYPTRQTERHWYDISHVQVKGREVAYRYVVIGWLLIGASIGFGAGVMVVMFA